MLGTIVSVKHTVELEDWRDFIPHPMGMVYSSKHMTAQSIREELGEPTEMFQPNLPQDF